MSKGETKIILAALTLAIESIKIQKPQEIKAIKDIQNVHDDIKYGKWELNNGR